MLAALSAPGFQWLGTNHYGRGIVHLDNGDVIVVGLVPRYNAHDPANGMWNIGMFRYDAGGNQIEWGAGSPHHFWFNR